MTENERLIRDCIPRIISWYASVRRDLPWRREPAPYQVWVSEIMLQQTRIGAVLGYYERFLRAFPTVEALASADDDVLLKIWEGLGYYSRARNLKKAAGVIVRDYGGRLPRTARELKKLPGIGEYTAGAIASIAYGQPEPAVDGNVLRIASRLFACGDDIADPKVKANVTQLLRANYPSGREAALLTEGIMELGEVLCLPSGEARCEDCPVRELCRAYAAGEVSRYPVKTPKKERRQEKRTVLLLRCGEKYALRRRPSRGLLAGLWEFPNVEGWLTAAEAVNWVEGQGSAVLSCVPCGEARHIFTHLEWHMCGYDVSCEREIPGFTWKTPAQIAEGFPIPTALRAFQRRMEENKGNS